MKEFLLSYISQNKATWKVQPQIFEQEDIQDNILLIFGQPKTAVFAHMDTTGFMVRYNDQLIPIGSPHGEEGDLLTGQDYLGPIECKLKVGEEDYIYDFPRGIQRGTTLTFKPEFSESKDYVKCCYLDNRIGIWNALKLAETLENGILVFSCWEEHGGGAVPMLARIIYERYGVKQALISDVTWVTEGVEHGKGVVVSIRDRNIPRRSFIDKIINIAGKSGIDFQIEVEESGSSDGRELQLSPYPFDWCFIGAPESNVHSAKEIVYKNDILSMEALYKHLMREL